MILVDTGIWIDYFSSKTNKNTDLLDQSLIDSTVAIGDLIFLEILQGLRNDRDYRKAKPTLVMLDQYELFREIWFRSARTITVLLEKLA